MAVIFQVQTQDAVSSIDAFNNAVRASGKVIGDFTTQSVKLNEQGQITSGVINQMSASGQKLSATFAIVGQSAQVMGAEARKAGEEGAKGGQAFAVSWQGLVRIMEVQLFRRGVTAVVNALRDGIQSAVQYQIQLQQVANVTGQGGPRLDAFATRVRSLSEQFGINLFEGLGAAQIALSGQLGDAAKGFDVLTASMRLSQATGTEVAAATRLITTSLEAFHLEASQASRIADVFFTTAQRSRIPLEETQAAIGRVSQTAHALGITFEEMNALFLTVAQQGGRPTEAFSLLNQVMGRLAQPSQKLQEFLNSLGTPTVALARQTFGLTGFLQKLTETATQTPERLGDLSGSLRTLRGLMAITGESTQRFQQNLDALTRGGGGLTAAVAAVQKTPAQILKDEFEKLKNLFSQEIGTTFIKTVVDISKALGGAEATVQGFMSAVKSLTIAFVGWKIVAQGVPAIMNAIALSQASATAATATATTGWTAAAAAVNLYASAAAIGVTAGILLAQAVEQNERARLAAARARGQAAVAEADRQITLAREASARQATADQELVNRAYRGRLERAAAVVQSAIDVRNAEINNHRQVVDAFRIASTTFLDTLRNQVSQTRQALTQIDTAIRQSRQSASEFGRSVEAGGFQRRLAAEQDPEAAIRLLRQRIEAQQAQATGIFTNPRSSQEEITRARAMFTEINRMIEEMGDRERQIQRARDEQTGTYREQIVNGQRTLVYQADFTQEIQRQNALVQERNRLEELHRANLEKQRAEQEKALATQQLRLRVFESLLRRQEQFRVFTPEGRLQPEFQRAEERAPGTGVTTARARFQEFADELRQKARDQGVDISEINGLIGQLERAMNREITAQEGVNGALRTQNELVQQAQQDAAVLAQLRERETAALTEARRIAGQIGRGLGESPGAGPRISGQLTALQALRTPTEEHAAVLGRVILLFNTYRQATIEAQQAQEAFNRAGGQTPENLQRFEQALTTVQERGRTLAGVITPNQAATLGLQAWDDLTNTFRNSLNRNLDGAVENARNSIQTLRDLIATPATQQLEQLRRQQQEAQRQAPGGAAVQNLEQIPALAATAQTSMTNALTIAAGSATTLNTQMSGIVANFERLGQLEAASAMLGGLAGGVGFMAGGGIAGLHPGAPRGTDILPYWLTPGEFIMPAEQTKQFYTQLLAMRSGQQPKYAAGGGVVTTVGDIHLHLDGSGPTEKTIRDIGRGLDREIRRGTIRLGRPS